jgi:hypothetical protein
MGPAEGQRPIILGRSLAAPTSAQTEGQGPISFGRKPGAPTSVQTEGQAPVSFGRKQGAPTSAQTEGQAPISISRKPAAPTSAQTEGQAPISIARKPAAPHRAQAAKRIRLNTLGVGRARESVGLPYLLVKNWARVCVSSCFHFVIFKITQEVQLNLRPIDSVASAAGFFGAGSPPPQCQFNEARRP